MVGSLFLACPKMIEIKKVISGFVLSCMKLRSPCEPLSFPPLSAQQDRSAAMPPQDHCTNDVNSAKGCTIDHKGLSRTDVAVIVVFAIVGFFLLLIATLWIMSVWRRRKATKQAQGASCSQNVDLESRTQPQWVVAPAPFSYAASTDALVSKAMPIEVEDDAALDRLRIPLSRKEQKISLEHAAPLDAPKWTVPPAPFSYQYSQETLAIPTATET